MSKNSLLKLAISILLSISVLAGYSIKTAKGELDLGQLKSSARTFLL